MDGPLIIRTSATAGASQDARIVGAARSAQVRPRLSEFFAELAQPGIRRSLLLSGDSAAHTLDVATTLGIR